MNSIAVFSEQLAARPAMLSRAAALAVQLTPQTPLAIYTQNAERLLTAIAAAAIAGAPVYLPPSKAAAVLEYVDDCCSYWLIDEDLPVRRPCLILPEASAKAVLPALENITLHLMSSGSTGAPKIFAWTLEAMCTEALLAFAPLLRARDALLKSTVSLQHRFGLSCHAFLPFLLNTPVQADSCEMPDTLLTEDGSGAVWWISSPAFLQRLAVHRNLPYWRGRVKGIFTAGGKLPDAVRTMLETTLDVRISNIYGTSETGALASSQTGGQFRFFPAVHVSVGEAETAVRAPWLNTEIVLEDRIAMQADGSFALQGRRDSVIKIAEKRIDLDDMQRLFLQHPAVQDAYIGVHPETGRLFAWLALSPEGISQLRSCGRKQLRERLAAAAAAVFPKIAVPRHWLFTDALPRNSESKLSKSTAETAILQPPEQPEWQTVESSSAQALYHGRVPLDLRYLRGHFDAFGIVPGVVEVKWVQALAALWLKRTVNTACIENLKFQKLLRPYDEVQAHLSLTSTEKLQFSVENALGVTASGRIPL